MSPTTRSYGIYGVDYACNYKGMLFVFSSVGVEAAGEEQNRRHAEFIRSALERSDARWKVCVWHMTMHQMQTSYKGDSTGWEVYELCRKVRACIARARASERLSLHFDTEDATELGGFKAAHTWVKAATALARSRVHCVHVVFWY